MKKLIVSSLLCLFIVLVYALMPMEIKFFFKPGTQNVIGSCPYYIDKAGWKFLITDNSSGAKAFIFNKIDGDTSKNLKIFIDDNNKALEVNEYFKTFKARGDTHCVRMDSSDTLFYYYENSLGRTFIKGEYYYRFTNVKLHPDEVHFFMLYKDSLTKIGGSNLPTLPSLNETEKKKFAEIFH